MRKALLALASLSVVALAGCASSSGNPWATPDSKPVAGTNAGVPASAATATPSDALFADDAVSAPAEAIAPAAPAEEDLLAEFPAIRKANLDKALQALKDASAAEVLPMPDKGNARITRYNPQFGVIEFITPDTYAVGDHVVLTKENKAALVTVLEVDGTRIVADLNAGVKGEIAAAQRKAQREALAAARAAMQQEQEALSESEDEVSEDEEYSEDEDFEDEEW